MPTESQPLESASQVSGEPIVREVVCKTILNRSGLSDYSLNCYTGCTHACVYCYARFMQRFHPHDEPWGAFVDVKVNAAEVLKRQLRRAEPGTVFVSSACDGWQPVEAQWRLTRRCCELLLERGFELHVLTKSPLVLRDLDVFAGRPVQIGVTLTTLDERLSELWEPGAASIQERLRVIEAARRAGLQTSVMFGPLLPFLSDSQASINALLGWAADLGIDRIWVDALNPRPRVWPAVAKLLRAKFPELLQPYRKILFDEPSRAEYLKELRARVNRAQRGGLPWPTGLRLACEGRKDSPMTILFALLLILVLLASWLLTMLGMPGNWLMVLAATIYAYLVPSQSPATLGWKTVVALLVLAALGEIVELVAGAMGVARAGGSRRGAVMALVGSVVGGILGVFIGVPIPLIGSVVAAVFFAGLGAMAGAILGEISVGQRLNTSWRISKAAFWGRLAGTLGKMIVGAVMVAVVVAALVL